jgi:hypothetical protein
MTSKSGKKFWCFIADEGGETSIFPKRRKGNKLVDWSHLF